MKKLILVLASIMFSSAHAAFFAGAIGTGIAGETELATVLAYCGGGVALVALLAGVATGNPMLVKIYLIMTLGQDGSFHQGDIAKQLDDRYPFINNTEVVNELALVVKKSYDQSPKNEKHEAYVSVKETDVLKVLNKTDLTPSEIELIVTELK